MRYVDNKLNYKDIFEDIIKNWNLEAEQEDDKYLYCVKEQQIFKYQHLEALFNFNENIIIHRGLYKALQIFWYTIISL